MRLALWTLLSLLLVIAPSWAVADDPPRLLFGGDHQFPPFEFLDKDGEPAGFNVDLTRAVAVVMGLDVEIRLGLWDRVRKDLESGRLDAMTGMVYSAQRDRLVDFSRPHIIYSNALFLRNDSPVRSLEDLRGKAIIVERGDIMHDLIKEADLDLRIITVDAQVDGLRLLASGKHDAALVEKLLGRYMAQTFGLTNIEAAGPVFEPMPYCFAVTEGNAELLAKLNEGLEILKGTGRYEEIYQKWFGVHEHRTVGQELLKYAGWGLASLLLLLAGASAWSWTLKKQVAQRTRELNGELAERRKAEEAIRGAHQKLQHIIEFLPDATFVVDQDKKVIAWNRVTEQMTGVPKDAILGSSQLAYAQAFYGASRPLLIDLLDTPDRELEGRYDFVRRQGQSLVAEVFVPSLCDGKGAYLWGMASPLLDQAGNRLGAIESIRDVTELEKLKEANRELDAFVYTVSHDLRSPLTPILGYANFLRTEYRERLDEQALDCLAAITASGNKMLALLEDLLALAKVGQLERPAESLATGEVVNEVLCELAEHLAGAGARVEVGELPPLRLPKSQLSQLFANLIGNAIRYGCQAGDIIAVGGERTGARVRLYVRDLGPGIPAEERRRIFEVFYRGSTGQGRTGSGVGLATVQKIAKLYNGRAWVEETPGGGSTFWVELVDR
jgi:PAS domain S-box-containing protein